MIPPEVTRIDPIPLNGTAITSRFHFRVPRSSCGGEETSQPCIATIPAHVVGRSMTAGVTITAIPPLIRTFSPFFRSPTDTGCDSPASYHPSTSPSALVHAVLFFSVSCFGSYFLSGAPTSIPSSPGRSRDTNTISDATVANLPNSADLNTSSSAPGMRTDAVLPLVTIKPRPQRDARRNLLAVDPASISPTSRHLVIPTLFTCQLPSFIQGETRRIRP